MKITRRKVLKGGAALSLGALSPYSVATTDKVLVGFTPVPFADGKGKMPVISSDYEYQVLLSWGEPLEPGGPGYRWPAVAEAQQQQIGIGHDGMAYYSLAPGRGLLALNHEYGTNPHVIGTREPKSLDQVRASQSAHGMSVVEIAEKDGVWSQQRSEYARRVHVNSPVEFSGPVAGDQLLANPANNPYLGTISNCSNGRTPWGTYLTCEENFNLYFGSTGAFSPSESQQRYGFNDSGGGYGWHLFDPRFDLSNRDYLNEGNRFGWVMEVDPMNPKALPVKRTALGRFKHEGATVVEADDGRVIVYMGDDSRFEFIYRFVSEKPWRQMRDEGRNPLDYGTLYVAKFLDSGVGEWLALDVDRPEFVGRFDTQAELLVNARIAATLVGATPMDRPEWIADGANGFMYCALTNNDRRKVPNAPNPQAPNPYGHIIRFRDNGGQRFIWEIFMQASGYFDGENSFSCPDGLWADPDGRLFIETDGDQRDGLNDQLIVVDTHSGEMRRLLTGVPGCETTGITTTPDRRTLFVNIQHPGKGDPAVTNFPHPVDGVTIPRDCTLAIRRKDGGLVGS